MRCPTCVYLPSSSAPDCGMEINRIVVWGSLGAHARGPLGLCDDVVGHLRGVPVAQATIQWRRDFRNYIHESGTLNIYGYQYINNPNPSLHNNCSQSKTHIYSFQTIIQADKPPHEYPFHKPKQTNQTIPYNGHPHLHHRKAVKLHHPPLPNPHYHILRPTPSNILHNSLHIHIHNR